MRYGWHDNPEMWQSAAQAIRGLNWSRHPLHMGYSNSIPVASGIYVMTLTAAHLLDTAVIWEKLQAPMYIGKSDNLQVRFKQHLRGQAGTKDLIYNFPRLTFWYTKVNEPEMSRVEAVLITVFGPSVNQIQPISLRAKILPPVPA